MIHINSGSSDCVNSMKGVNHKLIQIYYLWVPWRVQTSFSSVFYLQMYFCGPQTCSFDYASTSTSFLAGSHFQ